MSVCRLSSGCASRFPSVECDPPGGCAAKALLSVVRGSGPGGVVLPAPDASSASGNAFVDALAGQRLVKFDMQPGGGVRVWPQGEGQ